MLRDLHIQNFALIDELQIQFQPGLNILTGETGAGKSIILDALDMLLGGRASSDFIRTGKKKALIEAVFEFDNDEIEKLLEEMGIEFDSHQLLLSREITESGNNRLRINGQLATRKMVSTLARHLIDIHGQHEHQTLMHKHEHLRLLDEYGGKEVENLKKKTAKLYAELSKIKRELKSLRQNEQEKNQRIDLLKFQIDEIDKAQLKVNEEEELQNRRKILINAEKLFKNAGEINQLLSGDGYEVCGIIDLLGRLLKNLEDMSKIDQNLGSVREMVENAYYQLEEVSYEMRNYTDGIEFNQEELMNIEERLSLINNLKRKYGQTIEEILNYRQKIGEELSSLTHSEERIEELESKLIEVKKKYCETAIKLSKLRKEIGLKFAWKVMRELNELSMPNAKFVVQLDWQESDDGVEIDGISYKYGPDGLDQVEFLISPNPGESLKPLVKIASGGEISRIMLAIKAVTVGLDQIDTIIFDEIDSGVGGETGQRVAERLALIAKEKQVICITHLPQIAAMADTHFHIYKEVKGSRTSTNLVLLSEDERIEELARMYGGTEIAAAMEHASAMLKMARKKKAAL
ncbi:DNA repair protein RecN [Anoxybacter fermentans]|uniref:DNA repair protein RecN n=1 Tax=Anoxybacter fermentans TaxID=1323375 RepID=A0A3Q9HR91_9FIRM|nr:DNA repair protein RecN [Anoxybacter fermentans]AZR73514.1 DNA repair protein RecN [Anoxybacter fermentans]